MASTVDATQWPGAFTDLTLHARGGLGEVFRATDSELHRTVAVKCILERHAANPDSRRRFLLEAEITAGLDHPGVVPVYGLFQGSGRPAYAMRFVEGQTLGAAIATYHANAPDPISFRRLLQAFLQVCQTVAYAHSRGVIHRDLKPDNIMLGQFGETLVIDWGLAKVVGRPEEARMAGMGETLVPSGQDSEPGETAMGSAIGTPAYMSPEQAAGRWDVVVQASDVYSLGAVLYTVLTAKQPLEKGNWPEMQQRIQRGHFPRPRQVKPDVPLPLEAACMKAMALDPPDRYASAEALATDVEHWMADEPLAAYRDPLATHTRRWMRKHRTLVIAGAVLLVTALAAAGAGLILLGQKNREVAAERNAARKAADEADAERNAARAAADEATAMNAFLTEDLLGQASPDVNARDKKVTVEEALAKAAAKIDGNTKFAGKPQVEATLRMALGNTYIRLGNLAEAERHLRRAVDLRRAHLSIDDPQTLVAQEALADCLNRADKFAEAEPFSQQTWEARKRVLGPTHRDTLDTLDTYVSVVKGLGRIEMALNLAKENLDIRRQTLGPEDPDTLGSMTNVAHILMIRGHWVDANGLLRQVIEIKKRTGVDSETFAPAGNLGLSLYYLGELDEAEKILARYAEMASRQLGDSHYATQNLRSFLARVWVERGKADRAVGTLNDLIAARRKDSQKGDWRTALCLIDLGRAKLALGKPDEAAAALEEARQMYLEFPPQTGYTVPWADACLGAALLALQKYPEAEKILLKAEKQLRGLAVCPHRHYQQTVEGLVQVYERLNNPTEAAKWRKQLAVVGNGK